MLMDNTTCPACGWSWPRCCCQNSLPDSPEEAEYAFDVTLSAVVRVKAKTRAQAADKVAAMDSISKHDIEFGTITEVSVITAADIALPPSLFQIVHADGRVQELN